MKTIVWKGCTVSTRYGLMIAGREIEIPEKDADSYVKQKLASYKTVHGGLDYVPVLDDTSKPPLKGEVILTTEED